MNDKINIDDNLDYNLVCRKMRREYIDTGYKLYKTTRVRHRKGKIEYDKVTEIWYSETVNDYKNICYEDNKKEVMEWYYW